MSKVREFYDKKFGDGEWINENGDREFILAAIKCLDRVVGGVPLSYICQPIKSNKFVPRTSTVFTHFSFRTIKKTWQKIPIVNGMCYHGISVSFWLTKQTQNKKEAKKKEKKKTASNTVKIENSLDRIVINDAFCHRKD
jgi:hypothetical protein